MGADFYPRLTAVAQDNAEGNRLINEQAEIGLLLAGPGIIATLTLAPFVMSLFYSSKFGPAVEVLRWICLGMFLRVSSWPMACILFAKGEGRLFFLTELVSQVAQIGLVWFRPHVFWIERRGHGIFRLVILYWLIIYSTVRRLTGFRWSTANKRLALLIVPLLAALFAGGISSHHGLS